MNKREEEKRRETIFNIIKDAYQSGEKITPEQVEKLVPGTYQDVIAVHDMLLAALETRGFPKKRLKQLRRKQTKGKNLVMAHRKKEGEKLILEVHYEICRIIGIKPFFDRGDYT